MKPSSANLRLFLLTVILLSLVACGGGIRNIDNGDRDNGDTVTFDGGSLDDLKAINPSLVFDRLEITGILSLPRPLSDSITIKANSLAIRENGAIWSPTDRDLCRYSNAPSITLEVKDDVVIEGEIELLGRDGKRVAGGASCNSCNGTNGGDISISAGGNITVTGGSIVNKGGYGSSYNLGGGIPSSPCRAGDSGKLALNAGDNMTLNATTIRNLRGRSSGDRHGLSDGAAITTGNLFTMSGGIISTSGALSFQANLANIAGPILYGSLTESIGGSPDTSPPPVLTLISPQPNSVLDWNQPFQIQLQASADGMGLRYVRVTGFGYDQVHYESEFVNGVLTVDIIPKEDTPTDLNLIATNNKGLQTNISIAGLTIAYPREVEPNDDLLQAQVISSGGLIHGDIFTGDSGYASSAIQNYLQNEGDPGWSTRLGEDVYAITLSPTETNISVELEFAGNPGSPDIDLYLLNSDGTRLVATSTRDNPLTKIYTERIDTPAAPGATYYLVLQAYDVRILANYRLRASFR